MPTPHIESNKEDIASKVIMPGDPKRAEYIANKFLSNARLVNTVRGENAYTGFYKGEMITVFPSGMGIPSMGIYSYELYNDYDVSHIIRIGTAGSYDENIKLNDIFLAESACSFSSFDEETTGENKEIVNGSQGLASMIQETASENNIDIKKGRVYTAEAFYSDEKANRKATSEYGALVVEMETYALFINAKKLYKEASSLLTISDTFYSDEKLSIEDRVKKLDSMIILALDTLIKL